MTDAHATEKRTWTQPVLRDLEIDLETIANAKSQGVDDLGTKSLQRS